MGYSPIAFYLDHCPIKFSTYERNFSTTYSVVPSPDAIPSILQWAAFVDWLLVLVVVVENRGSW